MSHDLIPIASFLLSLGLTLFLYLELKWKSNEQQARWIKRQQCLEMEIGKLRGVLTQLQSLPEADAIVAVPRQPQDSLNLNRRTQAIRLFRRGEDPDKVAQILSIPLQESALLWKVYRAIATPLTSSLCPAADNDGKQKDHFSVSMK